MICYDNVASHVRGVFVVSVERLRAFLDVCTENAEVYCEDIKAWAKSALEDVEELDV